MEYQSNGSRHERKMAMHAQKGILAFEKFKKHYSLQSLPAALYHSTMAVYHQKMGKINLNDGVAKYA